MIVHPGRNAGPQRLAARVKIRAIADVLDNVARLSERCGAHPGHTLTAHLGQIAGMPGGLLDQTTHAVAADTSTDYLAFQRSCRAIVRTTGTVIRLTRQKRIVVTGADGLQDRQARRYAWCLTETLQPWPEPFDDHISVKLAMHGEKGRLMLVILAQDTRTLCHVVETVTQLRLYEGTFFLNHDDLFQTCGKAPYHLGIQRVDDAQTQHPDAQALQRRAVQAHVVQRLAQIRIALAGTDQPDAVIARVLFDTVEPIGVRIRPYRRMAVVEQTAAPCRWCLAAGTSCSGVYGTAGRQ